MENENKFIIIRIIISIIFFVIALFIHQSILLSSILFLFAYLIIGFDIIKEAIENIFHGKFLDENFLMFIATVGAFAIGEYPEAVAVMLLYQIGEYFEDYAVDKSRDSITELMDIRPDYANIEINGQLTKVNPKDIQIGDIIVVNPGEKIPLDGVVFEGESLLDTSSITGESVLREVYKNVEVFSGTINKTSMLKIKVSKKYEDSTVSKILELVENASEKKAKAENFITKFAKYYTPIVVGCALLLAILPPLFFKESTFAEYIYRACSFLVISCPCALVISIPLGFFAGLGGASKKGILIKGSNYIEALSKVKAIVFDKTGTLTEGNFEVTKICPIDISKDDLLKYTAYAENYSKHPISISIKKAYGKSIDSNLVTQSTDIPGKGINAIIEEKNIYVGNINLMNDLGLNIDIPSEVGTILYIAIDGKYSGYIVISDVIKNESKTVIEQLNKNKINSIMLTGDHKNIASQVARELQLRDFYAELLPQDKVLKLENILSNSSKNGIVAFVGDGTNDAPVLTRADIGIAMGGLGSDSAIEAADVVIMDDNLLKIDTAIKIANKTLRIVKENIWLAISVKLIVLILSAFGFTTMWGAVFADVGVALIAILNSMRALKI